MIDRPMYNVIDVYNRIGRGYLFWYRRCSGSFIDLASPPCEFIFKPIVTDIFVFCIAVSMTGIPFFICVGIDKRRWLVIIIVGICERRRFILIFAGCKTIDG